jgi:hypothetical protein
MNFFIEIYRFFKNIRCLACIICVASLPFWVMAQPTKSDSSSSDKNLSPLQEAIIKESIGGKSSLYPCFQQREEDLFTSNNFYAVARRPQKKAGETESVAPAVLNLFDLTGKKRCSMSLDEKFCDVSLSDVSWFTVNRIVKQKDGARQCFVYDQNCTIMARVRYNGASMLISPSGDFGTVSGLDPTSGTGDFLIYCFRNNSAVNAAPVKNAVFMGARFCRDNSLVTLWSEKSDSASGITLAKYDAVSGALIVKVSVANEKARPLACPISQLLHFEESPDHDLFAFFAIDDRYSLTAQQSVPNTTVVFDQDLRVKLFSSDRIHRTVKVVDDNVVAVGTWFDATMFSIQDVDVPAPDEKIELFDFIHEKAIGETEGVASPLISAVCVQDEIYCVFEVNTVFLAFNRSLQKFTRLWQESAGGVPIATMGTKLLRYSFSARKFTGL